MSNNYQMRKITLFTLMLIHFSVIAQIKVGTKAPELKLEGIYNRENSKIPTLETLHGKIVILDFWATWCSPCVAAFPENNELSNKYKDKNVQFIAITDDPKEKLENFLGKMKVDFWVGRDDDNKDFKNYNVNGRPQMYIINKEGTIVYQGNKVTAEMIEEAIATNTVNLQKKEEYLKVITNGGFSPGEDPLYNAVSRMLGKDKSYRPSLIEHVIIRPSLEPAFGGYGMKNASGKVGITYSGGDLLSIFMFLHGIPSSIWITDKTKDSTRYDIIYWKKTESFKSAYAEIEQKLTAGLSIKLDTAKSLQTVNLLSVNKYNEFLKKYEEIEAGTLKLYTHINNFASQLEEKSKQYYIVDESSQNTFIYNKGMEWKDLNNANTTKILDFLKERGISVNQEKRTINLFEINHK